MSSAGVVFGEGRGDGVGADVGVDGQAAEWRATAGDLADKHAIRVTVYPDGDDPGRGREPDLWRTRAAAVRGLAARNDPALTGE